MAELDHNLFLYLNSMHSPFWDGIMWFMSAKLVWIPLYLFIIYLLWRKYQEKIWIVLIFALLTILMADQISVFIKVHVGRLRPCRDPAMEGLVHMIRNICGGKYSFVSSHAANTFALAALSAPLLKKRWFSISIFLWAAVVSYSRVYLGVHYPGDVLCGAILGMIIGFGFYFAARSVINRKTVPEKK